MRWRAKVLAGEGAAGAAVSSTVESSAEQAAPTAATASSGIINLAEIEGSVSITNRPELSNIFRNDGKLAEQVGPDLMETLTGLKFRPIQNGSGNGADLAGIDDANRIIWAPEIKSSWVGSFENQNSLNLMDRTKAWIDEAADRWTIAGKQLTPDTIQYANKCVICCEAATNSNQSLCRFRSRPRCFRQCHCYDSSA